MLCLGHRLCRTIHVSRQESCSARDEVRPKTWVELRSTTSYLDLSPAEPLGAPFETQLW